MTLCGAACCVVPRVFQTEAAYKEPFRFFAADQQVIASIAQTLPPSQPLQCHSNANTLSHPGRFRS